MNRKYALKVVPSTPLSKECPDCSFVEWGERSGLNTAELKRFCSLVEHRRPRKSGELLYRAGSALGVLYVIYSGFSKTIINDGQGHEQITGFSMPGDLIGLDAIATGKHQCTTVALEDSRLCGMSFADLQTLIQEIPALQRHFHRSMGAEITRDHGMMMLLGAMRAEQRAAMFLLNLSRRFALRGRSATRFRLPMTRQEIGNYLGLQLETVSRAFSHLADAGLLVIDYKDFEITDPEGLQLLLQGKR